MTSGATILFVALSLSNMVGDTGFELHDAGEVGHLQVHRDKQSQCRVWKKARQRHGNSTQNEHGRVAAKQLPTKPQVHGPRGPRAGFGLKWLHVAVRLVARVESIVVVAMRATDVAIYVVVSVVAALSLVMVGRTMTLAVLLCWFILERGFLLCQEKYC